MKIAVIVSIDEAVHGDGDYYTLVAALLRLHANDIERTQGAVPTLSTVNDDGHSAVSTRIDIGSGLTAAEYLATPTARLMGMPTAPGEKKPFVQASTPKQVKVR